MKRLKIQLPAGGWRAIRLLQVVIGDPVSLEIVGIIMENKYTYLGNISRTLTARKIASRRTTYNRLCALSDLGILKSRLEAYPLGPAPASSAEPRTWVRMYTIAPKHREWINRLMEAAKRKEAAK